MNNLATKYGAGFTEAPDANYPLGGFKNETTPGLKDGTPYEKGWADDLNALMQGLLTSAGITASGTTDTILVSQLLQGLLHQVSAATYLEDTGAADAYVVDAFTDHYDFESYKDGALIRFIPDNTNTGASTIDVSGLGAVDIKDAQGAALTGGELVAGDTVTLQYSSALGDYIVYHTTTVPTGMTRQVVNVQDGAVADNATTIPFDNSIPQNTEGSEYMTLAITPKKSTNKLKIDVTFMFANNSAVHETVALFQDATANALAAAVENVSASDQGKTVTFTHFMTAGTTSATTFKVRAGGSAAGTTTFNGQSTVVRYGGIAASSITITETEV